MNEYAPRMASHGLERAAPERTGDAAGSPDARVTLLSILGFWIFYLVIVTIRSLFMQFDDQLDMFTRRVCVGIVGIGLTWLMYLGLRRWMPATLGRKLLLILALAVPASTAFAFVNYSAFYLYKPVHAAQKHHTQHQKTTTIVNGDKSVTVSVGVDDDEMSKDTPLMMIADTAINDIFFFGGWGALYLALGYAGASALAERRAAAFREQAQAAELRALRYQVNPHFLFNTLNSLSSLVLAQRTQEAEKMIMNLATFFRTSLTGDPSEDVMLAEELRLQRLYLDIEGVRFPDRLEVAIDVPASLRTACVPGLILQPLVENAIKYGVSRARRPVLVSITATERDRNLHVVVEDDGDPIDDDRAEGTGVGLANVRDRLAARFGDAASCTWGPLPAGGFRVALRMPLIRHGC
ncbi:sensor histidine kinase [Flavisphingomonas formosensis]|uniref:sensor histidine kinase n=1 Tax=Flavisphingomonas formosensis TaxID=861534 RepID=UPI001E578540|nr:histidine kinase [Sphingomonas formosensis]